MPVLCIHATIVLTSVRKRVYLPSPASTQCPQDVIWIAPFDFPTNFASNGIHRNWLRLLFAISEKWKPQNLAWLSRGLVVKLMQTRIFISWESYVLSVTVFVRVKQRNQIPSQTNIIKWYRGKWVQRKSHHFNTNFRGTQHKRLSTQVRARINMKSRRHIWFQKSIFKSEEFLGYYMYNASIIDNVSAGKNVKFIR